LKEQLYRIIEIIALVAYHLPLIFVIIRKMWNDYPVRVFAFYWTLGGLVNLCGSVAAIPQAANDTVTIIFNIIDAPFVLYILYVNTHVEGLKKATRLLIPLYLFIEILNGVIRGFTKQSFVLFLGVGVVVIMIVVLAEIVNYFKKMDQSAREKAVIFLYFALLFEYASYIVVYIFTYIKPENELDNLIIYYASTFLGIIIASFGFLSNNLKKRKSAPKVVREYEAFIKIID
jgi:hypothetical protein